MSMMTKMYMNLRKGVCMVEWCVGGLGFQKGCIMPILPMPAQVSIQNLVPRRGRGWPSQISCSTCRNSRAARWRRSRCRPARCRSGPCGTSGSARTRIRSPSAKRSTSTRRCSPAQKARPRRYRSPGPKINRCPPSHSRHDWPRNWPLNRAQSETIAAPPFGRAATAVSNRQYTAAGSPRVPACGKARGLLKRARFHIFGYFLWGWPGRGRWDWHSSWAWLSRRHFSKPSSRAPRRPTRWTRACRRCAGKSNPAPASPPPEIGGSFRWGSAFGIAAWSCRCSTWV